MSAPAFHCLGTVIPLLGALLWVAPVSAKTSGTHQNKVRKEVLYSVGGDVREARITFMDSTGRVEHEIVHVPWKLKIMMPCKSKVSLAARNLSPNGNIIARIQIAGQDAKEVKGQGHLAGVFVHDLTCP